MAKTRTELIARQHHLAWRAESLATIAVIGSLITAAMFAIVLAISQDLAVSAVAASPIAVVIVAWAWAVQTRIRFRTAGRGVAAFRDFDVRGTDTGAIGGASLADTGFPHDRDPRPAARSRPDRQVPVS